uniref:Glycerol-3-phosphate ABC transporter, periplasmic glycerol-3-phosphate-binding protein n=1 Tax=uncultured Armatimonadetes bacterium TaxID=157466 RepID=A0A6J4HSI4_9BACT|nr:Glycerol-3-phosphate ABC transporter, periplasmic glycerol-3-phosphate-binding protein [uncultured Armatimonadetes bacterium]
MVIGGAAMPAGGVVMPLMAACAIGTGESDSTRSPVAAEMAPEIEIYHQHAATFMDPLLEQYHQEQSKVRARGVVVAGGYEGLLQKVQLLASAGTPPAVAQAGFTYTRFMAKRIPMKPVADFIAAEKFTTADIWPAMLKLGQDAAGKQWGLPFAVSTPIFYYNANMLERIAVNPDRPARTWVELREQAQRLTREDQKGVAFNYTITGNWTFQAMVECAGGRMCSPDGRTPLFHEAPGVRALTYWTDLVLRDASTVPTLYSGAGAAFYVGKLAYINTTTASLDGIRRDIQFPKEQLRTMLFPTDGTNPRRVPAGGNNVFVLGATPPEQRAGWDLVKFLVSPMGTSKMSQSSGYMAVRRSTLDKPEQMGTYLQENPIARTTYDQVGDMVPWHEFETSDAVQVRNVILAAQEAALKGEKTPRQALEDAAAQVKPLLG